MSIEHRRNFAKRLRLGLVVDSAQASSPVSSPKAKPKTKKKPKKAPSVVSVSTRPKVEGLTLAQRLGLVPVSKAERQDAEVAGTSVALPPPPSADTAIPVILPGIPEAIPTQ
ncbi:unnamed protein product, partial [marine sediment metagenome]